MVLSIYWGCGNCPVIPTLWSRKLLIDGGQRLKTYWHLFVKRSLMRDGILTQPYRVTRTCITSWWVPLITTETDQFHRFHARKNHKCSANNHTQITTRSNLITRNPLIKRKKTTTPNVLNGTKIFPHLLFFWLIDLKRNRCNKNNSLGQPFEILPSDIWFWYKPNTVVMQNKFIIREGDVSHRRLG